MYSNHTAVRALARLVGFSARGFLIASLAACSGGGSEGTPGSGGSGTDPTPDTPSDRVGFSQSHYTVKEGEGFIKITVERTGAADEVASVDYLAQGTTATAGEDFLETSGTLHWEAGDNLAKSFMVRLKADVLAEGNETVILELSQPEGTALGAVSSAELAIENVACAVLDQSLIDEDTTLSEPCYLVERSLVVDHAATLTIDPGTYLAFSAGTLLEIEAEGLLNAVGTEEKPIVFTGERAVRGYWKGIEVRSLAPSQIMHATVEFAGDPTGFIEAGVGVTFDGRLRMSHSTVRHSQGNGLMLSGADARLLDFSHNTITLNERAPVRLSVNQAGFLDAASGYRGNVSEAGLTQDHIELVGNRIDEPQTWKALDVDYRLPAQPVDVKSVLTIDAGCRLVFGANGGLNIDQEGTLKAIGTEDSPILFTGLEAIPGYWRGIQFLFNNQPNEMDHTVVEYGGNESSNVEANVGVFGSSGRLSIRNSVLQHSGQYGFNFDDGIALTFESMLVTDNARTGILSINDVAKLDRLSSYQGNTDDRVGLTRSILAIPDQTIPRLDVPYVIRSGYDITVDNALTIDPGTELQFPANVGLSISLTGSLRARGTPALPIVFTGEQKVKGFWSGIQFTFSNSPANLIEHAVVEYGGQESGNTNALIGFFGGTGLPTHGVVSHSVLRGSLANGIELASGTSGSFGEGNTFIDIDGADILDPR